VKCCREPNTRHHSALQRAGPIRLYRLRDEAQVNITILTVRLGLIYLRHGDKKIYQSKDAVTGH
jgi:hypothetical protein